MSDSADYTFVCPECGVHAADFNVLFGNTLIRLENVRKSVKLLNKV